MTAIKTIWILFDNFVSLEPLSDCRRLLPRSWVRITFRSRRSCASWINMGVLDLLDVNTKWWPDVGWCRILGSFFRVFSGWWNVVPNHSQAFRDRIHLLVVMCSFWCQSSPKWQTTLQIKSLQFINLSVKGDHAKVMIFCFFGVKFCWKGKPFKLSLPYANLDSMFCFPPFAWTGGVQKEGRL